MNLIKTFNLDEKLPIIKNKQIISIIRPPKGSVVVRMPRDNEIGVFKDFSSEPIRIIGNDKLINILSKNFKNPLDAVVAGLKKARIAQRREDAKPFNGPWFYQTETYINYGIGTKWDQLHLETPKYLVYYSLMDQSDYVGMLRLFCGRFINPGIHTTKLIGKNLMISEDFSNITYDGRKRGTVKKIVNNIVSLLKGKKHDTR